MAKKKFGDGSWDEVTKKGYKYQRFRKYYKGLGKQKEFTGVTKADVKRKVQAFEDKLNNGQIVGVIPEQSKSAVSRKTFGDCVRFMLNSVELSEKKNNWNTLNSTYENYIHPYPIDKLQFQSVTTMDFDNHFKLLSQKYSLSTIKKVRTLINKTFEYYKVPSIIRGTKLPNDENCAVKRKNVDFLTLEETDLFYEACHHKRVAGEHFGVKIGEEVYGRNVNILVLILYTGMRIGECYAIKWKDVDLTNRTVHITHTKERLKNFETNEYEWVYSSPKKPSSVRYVPLSNRGVEALTNLKETTKYNKPDDFVVLSDNGIPGSQSTLTRTLHSVLKTAGIQRDGFGLHDLRHSFGSMMLEKSYRIGQPIDLKILSELMGHKDVQTTMNIYLHIIQERKAASVNILDM